ncbi:MAG: GAF domain-containing protein [bacterium]|nr:GAF domain-containing protein [bacterium]
MADPLATDFAPAPVSDGPRRTVRALSLLEELERQAQAYLRDLGGGKLQAERQRKLVELLNSIGAAQENLRVQSEFERERQENAILQEVSLRLSSAADIREVLRAILESLRQVVEFDAAGIFVYNRELQQIEVDMLAGYGGAQKRRVYTKFQEGVKHGEGVVATVVFSGKPIYVPDVLNNSRYVEVRPTTRSELAVPILVRDEIIGAFNLRIRPAGRLQRPRPAALDGLRQSCRSRSRTRTRRPPATAHPADRRGALAGPSHSRWFLAQDLSRLRALRSRRHELPLERGRWRLLRLRADYPNGSRRHHE